MPAGADVASRSTNPGNAGRGFVTIALAKVWFVLTGYAIHFALPRLLGSPESFGRFSAALNVASLLNNVLIASTIMAVSRFTSADDRNWGPILRQAAKRQLLLGVALALALFALAPTLAVRWLRDSQLVLPLQVVTAVVAAYALYAAFVGSLNGRHLFVRQARLDATFSALRTVGILGGAGFAAAAGVLAGEVGALIGFAVAALLILLIAAVTVGFGPRAPSPSGGDVPWSVWGAFLGPIVIYQLCLNGILLGDLLILKGMVAGFGDGAGRSQQAAAEVASAAAGVYAAAQKFAFVPYQLMIGMTFVVFPLISRATASADVQVAARTLRTALRAAMLLLLAIAAPISAVAPGLLRLAFPQPYVEGALALSVLVVGAAAFALFVITASAHSAAGRPTTAAWLAGGGLLLMVALNVFGLRWAFGHVRNGHTLGWGGGVAPSVQATLLLAAAVATTASMVATLFASVGVLQRRYGCVMSPPSVARGLLAAVAAWLVARVMPGGQAWQTLLALSAAVATYLAVLLLARELSFAELRSVWRGLARSGDRA